jgi:enamine deaminase RidA (YjgF/YER057c/UK114 family)
VTVSKIRERITQLGLELPPVAPPAGAYLPAVISGNLVFTAGQIPLVEGKLIATGKVGSEHTAEAARAIAARCCLNAIAAIESVIGDLDRVKRVVKVVGFVASTPEFTAQPTVLNGASELLEQIFGDTGRHARSAVGVASLPLDAPVEVELIVEFE